MSVSSMDHSRRSIPCTSLDRSQRSVSSQPLEEMQDLLREMKTRWPEHGPGTPTSQMCSPDRLRVGVTPMTPHSLPQQPADGEKMEMYRELERLEMALNQERQEKAALQEEKAAKEAQYQRDIAELEGMLRQVTTEKDRIMARNVHLTAELAAVKGAFPREAASPFSPSTACSGPGSTASGPGGYSEPQSDADRSYRGSIICGAGSEIWNPDLDRTDRSARLSVCASELYNYSPGFR